MTAGRGDSFVSAEAVLSAFGLIQGLVFLDQKTPGWKARKVRRNTGRQGF